MWSNLVLCAALGFAAEPETTPAEAQPAVQVEPTLSGDAPATPVADVVAEPDKKTPPKVEVSGAPGRGLTVKVGEAFSLNIRSRFQLRYTNTILPQDDAGERPMAQTFNIATARLWLSGHVFNPRLLYMVQLAVAGRDYRDGTISPIFDAYLDYKAHRDLSIRVGQYFVPFDRLRTVREFALQMVDRPRPVGEMTLDRDVGVTFYSDHFLGDRSPVAWRLGVFGGGGINLLNGKEPGALVVGRLELRPLGDVDDDSEGDLERRRKPGLAIGGAFAANINTNRQRSTTGATYVGGTTDYLHAVGDLVFKWRGFAVEGEFLWKEGLQDTIESTDADGNAVTEYSRSGYGWVAQASYLFNPPIEVVARFTQLKAAPDTDPKLIADVEARGNELGAGLNWYVNGHRFKVQADWLALIPSDFAFSEAEHTVHVAVDATF